MPVDITWGGPNFPGRNTLHKARPVAHEAKARYVFVTSPLFLDLPLRRAGLENQEYPRNAIVGTAREWLERMAIGRRRRSYQQGPNGTPGIGPSPYRAARRETVPQKTAIIAALTTSRPLCMACVSSRAGLSSAEVEALFHTIEEVMPLRREDGRCRACGTVGPVFSVDVPRPSARSCATLQGHDGGQGGSASRGR
jgi:hypothetical protein